MRSKPHTRGDEPVFPLAHGNWTVVNPTHVGMNPAHGLTVRCAVGKPHTRGDEPARGVYLVNPYISKPHTRGDEPPWQPPWLCSVGVNPTHVGMNREADALAHCAGRKPHTRGDEPSSFFVILALPLVNPTHVGMNRFNRAREELEVV